MLAREEHTVTATKMPPKDVFMQFADIEGSTGAVSNVLGEFVINTGLSVRGALIWIIHMIEIGFAGSLSGSFKGVEYAISSRGSLATMPELGDHGVLVRGKRLLSFLTSGAALAVEPHRLPFSPPVPIAAPALHLYVQGAADHADGRNKRVDARVGFTTVPLDSALYTEIAEVWGW